MGGYGSGISIYKYPKSKAENSLPIDIRALHKKNAIFPGNSVIISWSKYNGESSSISANVFKDHILLKYSDKNKTGTAEQRIHFDYTACNFGGKRIWFTCPACGRRCAVVYYKTKTKYFACRKCCNLGYLTQCVTKSDRLYKKANKLRNRIGALQGAFNDLPIFKPKYMHYKTFITNRKSIEQLERKGTLHSSWFKKFGCEV